MNIITACGIRALNELVIGAEVVISLRDCFAQGLATLLRRHSLTQVEFAKKIGVTQASVSRWINAKEVPVASRIDEIAEFFNVHPVSLFMSQDMVIPTGTSKVILDLEKLAAESGYIIKKKDS